MIDACQLPDDRADVDPARPSPGSPAIVTPASSPSLGGQKKACGPAAGCRVDCTTANNAVSGISPAVTCGSTSRSRSGAWPVGAVALRSRSSSPSWRTIPSTPKRFAFYVGRRCRASPTRDIAKELRLDGHTVKAMKQQDLREQLPRARTPGPQVIGLDEVSIKKDHTYRIVIRDLVGQRPIWFGGRDRSEASPDQFYAGPGLGLRKAAGFRLVVMDMWKPFRLATARHAPLASFPFDKVPRPTPSERRARPVPQARIRARVRAAASVHHAAEVHLAAASREPDLSGAAGRSRLCFPPTSVRTLLQRHAYDPGTKNTSASKSSPACCLML